MVIDKLDIFLFLLAVVSFLHTSFSPMSCSLFLHSFFFFFYLYSLKKETFRDKAPLSKLSPFLPPIIPHSLVLRDADS